MLSTELFVLFYRCYLQIVYTGDISIHSVKRRIYCFCFTVATYKLYILAILVFILLSAVFFCYFFLLPLLLTNCIYLAI